MAMDKDKSPRLRLEDNVYVNKIVKHYGYKSVFQTMVINQYFKRLNSAFPNMSQYVPSNLLMWSREWRQAMPQLHLSEPQVHCLLKVVKI